MSAPSLPAPGDFYRDGTPHLTPERIVELVADRYGVSTDQLGVAPVMVGTFFPDLTRELIERSGAQETVLSATGSRLQEVHRAGGVSIGEIPMGAPTAVMFMERMIAAGMETLLVVGAAGSLQPDLPIGSTVLPSEAIREEGTSHHYAPAGALAAATARTVQALRDACDRNGVESRTGLHWTTDAPFREHREQIDAYRNAGVLSVDMEVSALYQVARHRGVNCAAILAISDELFDHAGWRDGFSSSAYRDARSRAGEIALEAAQRLAETDG